MWTAGVVCAAFLVFANSLGGDFVYDDSRAVVGNPDAAGTTPWAALLRHDFWGGELAHSGSHRSWRPLTTASFRLNAALSTQPYGYHLVNSLLHSCVSGLVVAVASALGLGALASALAGLFFAVHPVHCEAVAGVVGRAELLCSLFFLCGVLSFQSRRLGVCVLCAGLALLSKEQGIALLPFCAVLWLRSVGRRKEALSLRVPLVLLGGSGGLVFFRLWVMGFQAPHFSASDNPAAADPSFLTRFLTFSYLPAAHLWLLLCPFRLSFDWSMGAVPLLSTLGDARNAASLTLYAALIWGFRRPLSDLLSDLRTLTTESPPSPQQSRSPSPDLNGNLASVPDANNNLVKPGRKSKATLLVLFSCRESSSPVFPAAALSVICFLPASNLFATVGFVLAERVLYLPSVGFAILISAGAERLLARRQTRRLGQAGIVLALICFVAKTVTRNADWRSEEALYRSGVDVNPPKALSNLGNVLAAAGRKEEAEKAYLDALRHRPNMADTHYNLGTLLHTQGRHKEAIARYRLAIQCRSRMAVAHLNLGLALWASGEKAEAATVLSDCRQLSSRGFKDARAHADAVTSCTYNLGRLHSEKGDHTKAVLVFEDALAWASPGYKSHHSLLNLYGEALGKLGRREAAETNFAAALRLKPDHVPAHLTWATLKEDMGDLAGAISLLSAATRWGSSAAWASLGRIHSEAGRHDEAVEALESAVELEGGEEAETRLHLAHVLRVAGRTEEAKAQYRLLLSLGPSWGASAGLGALLHADGALVEAAAHYDVALRLRPTDALTAENRAKLHRLLAKRAL